MRKFSNHGIVDTSTINQTSGNELPLKIKEMFYITEIMMGLIAIAAFFYSHFIITGIFVLFVVITDGFYRYKLVLQKREIIRRLKQTCEGGFAALSSYFDDDGYHIITSKDEYVANYKDIKAVYITDHYYLVQIKNEFSYIFRTCFSEEQDKEFKMFIKEKTGHRMKVI